MKPRGGGVGVDGTGGYSSAWQDRWEVRWKGNGLAANGVTYQFAQSFSGTSWATSSFTESTAANGNRTGKSRNDYGGSYRADLAQSNQAGNLPPPPPAAAGTRTPQPHPPR